MAFDSRDATAVGFESGLKIALALELVLNVPSVIATKAAGAKLAFNEGVNKPPNALTITAGAKLALPVTVLAMLGNDVDDQVPNVLCEKLKLGVAGEHQVPNVDCEKVKLGVAGDDQVPKILLLVIV